MPSLFLIKRGERPSYHKAPFHPVIICDRKAMAKSESGDSGYGATIWEKGSHTDNQHGWLLVRWNGFDIDYGHVVHPIRLPDGKRAGFWRDYDNEYTVKDLFDGAIWWSNKKMPEWLKDRGVIYPNDAFTKQWILDRIAENRKTRR